MSYTGFASLQSASDLFEKLKRDHKRLIENRNDPDFAFNFFVTALHLLDWLHPRSRTDRDRLEQSELLLQICSHIANGAKHFEATARKHKSVADVEKGKGLVFDSPRNANGALIFDDPRSGLIVKLTDEAEKKYGPQISVQTLADEIMKLWESILNK